MGGRCPPEIEICPEYPDWNAAHCVGLRLPRVTAASTVRLSLPVPVLPLLSWTETAKGKVPSAVGVPSISIVSPERKAFSPEGRPVTFRLL